LATKGNAVEADARTAFCSRGRFYDPLYFF